MRWLLMPLAIPLLAALMVFRPEDIPRDYRPWTPIDLDAAPNFVTSWKLSALGIDGDLCQAAIERTRALVKALPDKLTSESCGILDGVALAGLSAARVPPVETRCAIAARLYLWERLNLQPAARRLLGSEVATIEHYSSYSCRPIRTMAGLGNRMSQHATANAIDISGFTLTSGERVTLRDDWNGVDHKAAFLKSARDGLCAWFNVVLSPEYNALHADHFHVDMGPYLSCR